VFTRFATPAPGRQVVRGFRIFRYRRGDAAGRAAAQAHGRRLALPAPQLGWTV